MIATGVVTPFFVPHEGHLLVAFVIALPVCALPGMVLHRAGPLRPRKAPGLPLVIGGTVLFLAGMAFCYFFVFGTVFRFISQFARRASRRRRISRQYLAFVMSVCSWPSV